MGRRPDPNNEQLDQAAIHPLAARRSGHTGLWRWRRWHRQPGLRRRRNPTAADSARATEARTTGSTQSSQPAQSDAQTSEPGQQAATGSSATPASGESEPTATPEPALPAGPTSTPAPTPRPQVANPSLQTDRAALIALYEAADAENNWYYTNNWGSYAPWRLGTASRWTQRPAGATKWTSPAPTTCRRSAVRPSPTWATVNGGAKLDFVQKPVTMNQ